MKRALGTKPRCRRRFTAATAALVIAVTVAGCGTSDNPDPSDDAAAIIEQSDADGFEGTLVDPPLKAAPLTLRDTNGNPVRLDRLPKDKATAVFFGYTQCPDICPTTMADIASAKRSLGPELAQRVNVYFVTVDPERDTPKVLRQWLAAFGPGVVGLRGSIASVNQAERSLYAVESDIASAPTADDGQEAHAHGRDGESSSHAHDGAGYEVNHSGSVYVFGPYGETLLYSGGYTVDQYAADLTRLLDGPR